MGTQFLKILLIVCLIFIVQCIVDIADEKDVIRGCNEFGDDIYKEVAKEEGNIVFSPFSLYSSMGLLTMGASEDTLTELLNKLSLNDARNLKNGYETLIKGIQSESLRTANNLFISKQFHFVENYKNEAWHFFKAKPTKLDFSKPETAAAIINNWVAEQSGKFINKIVDEASLNKQTALILLNAIYFKGEWETKFDEAQTIENHNFYTSTGISPCSMMYMRLSLHNFTFSDTYSILSLPFYNTNIKIAFMKTGHRNITLTALEEIFNSKKFFETVSLLRPKNVMIKIPKFKISTKYELSKHLSAVGFSKIFQSSSFSNLIRENEPVAVDKVDQKCVLEINENGVQAVGATRVRMRVRSAAFYHKFVLDSPFLFFIYDSEEELIIFRGRIKDPTLSADN